MMDFLELSTVTPCVETKASHEHDFLQTMSFLVYVVVKEKLWDCDIHSFMIKNKYCLQSDVHNQEGKAWTSLINRLMHVVDKQV